MRTWLALTLLLSAGSAAPNDREVLTAGVTEVAAPGAIPAPVAIYGQHAFAVIAGKSGGALAAIVAATRSGAGRVVAVGHDGLFGANLQRRDNAALATNIVTWLAAGKTAPRVTICEQGSLQAIATAAGAKVTTVPAGGVVAALAQTDVLLLGQGVLSVPAPVEQVDAVAAWVQRGGGLLVAGCSWGWQQLSPGKDLRVDQGANRIVARMGLALADQMVDRTGREGWASGGDLDGLNAQVAFAKLLQKSAELQDKAKATQVGATLALALNAMPPTDTLLLPRVKELLATVGSSSVPTAKTPVAASDPVGRLAIIVDSRLRRNLAPQEIRAHPAAATFPGLVPPAAPRVRQAVSVDTRTPAWHSLGLYAAPGEVITIELPAAAANKGLAVRIGCHTDTLWHLEKWTRHPEVSVRQPLAQPTTQVASAFGGLVYLDVPGGCQLGTVNVTLAGVVEAPLYRLGVDTVETWQASRAKLGPWAELATSKVIITVPTANIQDLVDPAPLMRFWDEVLDACADLAQRPRERERPERYVPDQQISAGYMHSGYPIMTWMDAAPRFVDVASLRTKGDWGMFHEMGHNHQSGHWTFDGTTEVTVNLFTLYVYEKVCGVPVASSRMNDPKLQTGMQAHFATGAPFEKWKGDPFLALRMYVQLQQAFGWETFQKVFTAYRDAPREGLPKNDQEERDQWLVRFSRQVNRNLGPFFQQWGVPTSEAARAAVSGLPAWDWQPYLWTMEGRPGG
ncbi:MAG: hypothetical protein IT204_17380 [Fimbriimonadaceae bacterium]|nr:hypothetical protein [Fimbriimonadaceae bacterium]